MLVENRRIVSMLIRSVLIITLPVILVAAPDERQFDFHVLHRVVAHGDEFNSVLLSEDGERLFIGTEKGEVLIWSIPDRRIVRRLNQGSPVHAVVSLGSDKEILAAGGNHSETSNSAVVRKWNLEKGTFEEWLGMENDSVVLVRADVGKNLVVGSSLRGHVVVWEAKTGKPIARWNIPDLSMPGLALIGRTVYFTAINPQAPLEKQSNSIMTLDIDHPDRPPQSLFARKAQQVWTQLSSAPKGEVLAATQYDIAAQKIGVALINPQKGEIQRIVEGMSSAWSSTGGMVSFDSYRPIKAIALKEGGESDWTKPGWHAQGSPAEMIDLAITADGNTAFAVYRKGAALAKWDKQTGKADILTMTSGSLFAMDILEEDGSGIALTGGDDGFVRAWRLSDFSLRGEFHFENGVPQGVGLLDNGHKAVFSYSGRTGPTTIYMGDLDTGEYKQLLSIEKPFVQVLRAGNGFVYPQESRVNLADQSGRRVQEYVMEDSVQTLAVSSNGRWLAGADKNNSLYLFDLTSNQKARQIKTKLTPPIKCAVTNNGQDVFATDWKGVLYSWDTRKAELKELISVRGQTAALQLSADERLVIRGGNHRDVSIFDINSRKFIASFTSEAADFSITNVWLRDKHLVFSTDSGVILDGRLGR